MIETPWYTQAEQKSVDIKLKQPVIDLANNFLDSVKYTKRPFYFTKQGVHLFINNSKKVLLEKVYQNLQTYLRDQQITLLVKDINAIKAGMFTNPSCIQYLEPLSVTVLLTKKHNRKEKQLCEEALNAGIPLNIIMMGATTMRFPGNINCVIVRNIKQLYIFLYALVSRKKQITYDEFRVNYKRELQDTQE